MEKFLTTPNGSFIVTQNGYLIKNRPFEENLLPNGLLGDFSIEKTTKVNGYISEWLDRNGSANKLIQSNASLQLLDCGSYATSYGAQVRYLPSGFTMPSGVGKNYTFFICFDPTNMWGGESTQVYFSPNAGNIALLNSATSAYMGASGYNYSVLSNFFINGVSANGSSTLAYQYNVVSCCINNANASIDWIFDAYTKHGCKKVKSIAFYNRILSDTEQIYNHKALIARYNIT